MRTSPGSADHPRILSSVGFRWQVHGLLFISFDSFCAQRGLKLPDEPTAYSDERAYPDERFGALVEVAAREAGRSAIAILREFGFHLGAEFFPGIAPSFYTTHPSLVAALLAVEQEIHERVRKAVPDAAPPHLQVHRLGDGGAVIAYTSARRLCMLLEGLVHGTARQFETEAEATQPQCMLRGETSCSIVVQVKARGPR